MDVLAGVRAAVPQYSLRPGISGCSLWLSQCPGGSRLRRSPADSAERTSLPFPLKNILIKKVNSNNKKKNPTSLTWRMRKRCAGPKLSRAAGSAWCRGPVAVTTPALHQRSRHRQLERASDSGYWRSQQPQHSPHLARGAGHRPVHLLVEFPLCIVIFELVEPDLLVY